jgi:hypothetical protein
VCNNHRLRGFTIDTWKDESLRRYSFKCHASQGDKDGEQFEVWVREARPSHSRTGKMPFSAYARILTSGENPGPPEPGEFSDVESWDGLSQAFGDAERTVRLSFVRRVLLSTKFVVPKLIVELDGTIYSRLGQEEDKDDL